MKWKSQKNGSAFDVCVREIWYYLRLDRKFPIHTYNTHVHTHQHFFVSRPLVNHGIELFVLYELRGSQFAIHKSPQLHSKFTTGIGTCTPHIIHQLRFLLSATSISISSFYTNQKYSPHKSYRKYIRRRHTERKLIEFVWCFDRWWEIAIEEGQM